jgi:hypothetical protein
MTDTNAPPIYEQGKLYLVPCVQVLSKTGVQGFGQGEWVPVLDSLHRDPDINFPPLHYHYDWRFVSPKKDIRISAVLNIWYGSREKKPLSPEDQLVSLETTLKRRKCYEPDFVFPSNLCKKLEPLHASVTMIDRICPHRGVSLKNCPARYDGSIVCPAHGLAWDADTGKLRSRLSRQEAV